MASATRISSFTPESSFAFSIKSTCRFFDTRKKYAISRPFGKESVPTRERGNEDLRRER